MTTIKQVSVNDHAHVANVSKYLDDGRILARDSQFIANEDNWAKEMSDTRKAYGCDSPSRAGVASAYMYHQIIAFNPDDCDWNGGPMTPVKCMEFVREWVRTRHPNQEACWVLHREHCNADGTDRYAVHLAVNRVDLETGKRFNEGRARWAKVERANAMRDLDRKWGLREVRANERNSVVHARQPTRAEKEMAARGVRSDKEYIREAIKASVQDVQAYPDGNKLRFLARSLDGKGVGMTVTKDGKDFAFERKSTGRIVRGVKLGKGFSMAGIARAVGMEAAKQVVRAMEDGMNNDR